MYIYIYIYIYIHTYISISISISIFLSIYLSIYIYIHIHTHTHIAGTSHWRARMHGVLLTVPRAPLTASSPSAFAPLRVRLAHMGRTSVTVRAAAALYDVNEYGTNVCRPGYSKISAEAACAAAAAFLAHTYLGGETNAAYPSGCFVTPTDVRLNLDAAGAGHLALRPLCVAGKSERRWLGLAGPDRNPTRTCA